jgi:hypothetical protein
MGTFHGYVSWLHIMKKFHGKVHDGCIPGLCTIVHICSLELEYAYVQEDQELLTW